MSLVPGTRFGSYEVAALVGAGGMGDVYRATDTNLKRLVALKVLSETFVSDPNRLARLQREAEVLASLNHPNVAHIYGLERNGGTTALVMELVDGETLAVRLAQGALPPKEALDVALQIAAGLEAAHEQGIVHRDLKPANVKIKSDGTVKVLDFGIAKALDARAISGPQPPALTAPAMTEIGVVLGTPAYMAPEQARGKPVDKRADIWSFGCVLYEMLTGRAAFADDDVSTTLARVLEREPDFGALPAALAPAVRRTLELCLQKDVKKRLRDIGDVRLALEGELATQPAAGAVPRASLLRRALPTMAALVVGVLLAGAYFANRRPAEPEPTLAAPLPITRFVITPPASAPLADFGGYDLTISPDGKRIAYLSQDPATGRTSVYVREIDGLEARQIPGSEIQGGAGNMNPFFSADGKWIGLRQPGKGIMRVSVDGAPPLKLADDPSTFLGAAWLTDDTIVYSAGPDGLRRMSAAGGSPQQQLTPAGSADIIASPVPLPGGRAVLFSLVGDTERIAVLDLETGERKILIDGGQNPVYVPTGHIVFARGTTLMAAPFSASERALTGEPVALVQGVRHPNTQTAADYGLSANGTLVYVPGGEAPAGFFAVWVDRGGNVVERAINDPIPFARDPRLSPDGGRLALTTGSINNGGVWVYDLRGRPPIPLATGGDNRSAVWSPDGTQLAFWRVGAGGNVGVHITRADGSMLAPQPLRAEGLRGLPAVWSSAGELLLFNQPAALSIFATAAAAEGKIREVVATPDNEFDPALSPNGRWLAYVSNRTGNDEIWVKGYPEGVAVRVSRGGGFEPVWSADGRELYYLEGTLMMAVPVETDAQFSFGEPVRLFGGPFFFIAAANARSYDVARDGRFLMIQPRGAGVGAGGTTGSAELGSIVVVQNWTEELKQRVPASR